MSNRIISNIIAFGIAAGLICLLIFAKLVGLAIYFFLISAWFLISAVRPEMREPNRKVLERTSAWSCMVNAGYFSLGGLGLLLLDFVFNR